MLIMHEDYHRSGWVMEARREEATVVLAQILAVASMSCATEKMMTYYYNMTTGTITPNK